MKKFIVFSLIMFFLAGCSNTGVQEKEDILALKEKCAKYVPIAEARKEKERKDEFEAFGINGALIFYQGTFYSRTKKTCLSITSFTRHFKNDDGTVDKSSTQDYYDELTGVTFSENTSTIEDQIKASEVEKELNLVR